MNKELKNKLVKWTDSNTDYMVNETETFSDWNPTQKVLQVWKKRVNPIQPTPIKGKDGKQQYFRLIDRICDTHHFVMSVFPKRKYYDVGDNRLFSDSKTRGLTFSELIETIIDESCGYDMWEYTKKYGTLGMKIDKKHLVYLFENKEELTLENTKGMKL